MPEITIRFPEPRDAPAVADAVLESLEDLLPWMSWAHPGYAPSDARAWIDGQAAARAAATAFEFVIVDSADRLLGTCGINQINKAHLFANLGYWVRSAATGRGIAVEAVRHLQDWVFDNTEVERLEIVVALGNGRSHRVAEKAGAVREGILRSRLLVHETVSDATMFSIVRPPRPA